MNDLSDIPNTMAGNAFKKELLKEQKGRTFSKLELETIWSWFVCGYDTARADDSQAKWQSGGK